MLDVLRTVHVPALVLSVMIVGVLDDKVCLVMGHITRSVQVVAVLRLVLGIVVVFACFKSFSCLLSRFLPLRRLRVSIRLFLRFVSLSLVKELPVTIDMIAWVFALFVEKLVRLVMMQGAMIVIVIIVTIMMSLDFKMIRLMIVLVVIFVVIDDVIASLRLFSLLF